MAKNSHQKVPKSDFQSQFSTSKIIRIFLKIFFVEEYQFMSTFYVFTSLLHQNGLFGLKIMVKSGLEKFILKSLHAEIRSFLLLNL